MKISFLFLGCRANQSEVAALEATASARGHEIVALGENPELCIVNTCTVTSKSDYQSRQLIRRAQRAGAKVVVTGCYSELNAEAVGAMEGVAEVVRNNSKDSIATYFKDIGSARDPSTSTVTKTRSRARLTLKVQDGCNNRCTYCIVPMARGTSRSVTPKEIINNVTSAVSAGTSEVVLSGIHLGHYGSDLDMPLTLEALIRMILDETGIERLRLSSLELNELTPGIIELMENSRLCNHLHIPLQSGSNGVLKRMSRHYTREQFIEKMGLLIQRVPGIGLGTDIIVGFPDETDYEFNETLELVRELPFTYLHVFKYSPRPGTEAAGIKDIVGDTTRARRSEELRALGSLKHKAFMDSQVGMTLDMLIEQEVSPRSWRGTTSNFLKVQAVLQRPIPGSIVPVKVAGTSGGSLLGELISST